MGQRWIAVRQSSSFRMLCSMWASPSGLACINKEMFVCFQRCLFFTGGTEQNREGCVGAARESQDGTPGESCCRLAGTDRYCLETASVTSINLSVHLFLAIFSTLLCPSIQMRARAGSEGCLQSAAAAPGAAGRSVASSTAAASAAASAAAEAPKLAAALASPQLLSAAVRAKQNADSSAAAASSPTMLASPQVRL